MKSKLEITRPSSSFGPSTVSSCWLCLSVLKDVPLGLASMIARAGAGDDWAATLDEHRVDGGQCLSEAPFVTLPPCTLSICPHLLEVLSCALHWVIISARSNSFLQVITHICPLPGSSVQSTLLIILWVIDLCVVSSPLLFQPLSFNVTSTTL